MPGDIVLGVLGMSRLFALGIARFDSARDFIGVKHTFSVSVWIRVDSLLEKSHS